MNDSTFINFTVEVAGQDTAVKEYGMMRISKNKSFFRGRATDWKALSLSDTAIELGNDSLKSANRINWLHIANSSIFFK